MQKQCSGASEGETQSPPQITDGFRGNTAKFYFVILKDCVSNSDNIFSGKRYVQEDAMIIWDTLPIMEKSDKIDTVWFLNFIMATQKKELVVRKNSQFCHWNSPRAIFFLTTCTVQYVQYTSLRHKFHKGGIKFKRDAVVFDEKPHRH